MEGGRGKRAHGGREGENMSSVILSSRHEVEGGGRRVGWVSFFTFWIRGEDIIIYSILFVIVTAVVRFIYVFGRH